MKTESGQGADPRERLVGERQKGRKGREIERERETEGLISQRQHSNKTQVAAFNAIGCTLLSFDSINIKVK